MPTPVFGETLCIGVDLRRIVHFRPRGMTEDTWKEEYKGFWPMFIAKHPHQALFMFAHGYDDIRTIILGSRAEYYFDHYPEKSVAQFKRLVAREISRYLKIKITEKMVDHFSVQYVIEAEDVNEGVE